MSLALVNECAREVGRLVQAGSNLARGDFRLERLREPLRAAGAQATVFARLAEAVERLADAGCADDADRADRLLSLATLTRAVLATQAGPGVGAGDLRPLATTPAPGGSLVPYRQLEPALTALSTTGPGRLEAVRHAWDQGYFADRRLVVAAVAGLGDPMPEIGAFLADTVLPGYGPALAPLLRAGLDLQGGKAHARRLALIARLRGPAETALYREAAEQGSKEVRAAAVAALRFDLSAAPRLREWAKKGPKEVRAAALGALGALEPDASAALLAETLRGPGGAELALGAVQAVAAPALTRELLAAAQAVWQTLLTTVKEQAAQPAAAFAALVRALESRSDQQAVSAFLGGCLEHPELLGTREAGWVSPSGYVSSALSPLSRAVASALLTIGTPDALARLAAARGRADQWLLGPVFRAAAGCQPAAPLFDAFAPYLDPARQDFCHAVVRQLCDLVSFRPDCRLANRGLPLQATAHQTAQELPRPRNWEKITWDPRWRARLMALDGWKDGRAGAASAQAVLPRVFEVHEIVAALAEPGDVATLRYLDAQLNALPARTVGRTTVSSWYGPTIVLLGMVQGAHPRVGERLVETARKLSQLAPHQVSHHASLLRAVADKLPPAGRAEFLRRVAEFPEGQVRTQLLERADPTVSA